MRCIQRMSPISWAQFLIGPSKLSLNFLGHTFFRAGRYCIYTIFLPKYWKFIGIYWKFKHVTNSLFLTVVTESDLKSYTYARNYNVSVTLHNTHYLPFLAESGRVLPVIATLLSFHPFLVILCSFPVGYSTARNQHGPQEQLTTKFRPGD